MGGKKYSIVEYLEEHEGYRCGYCKSTDGNFSQGMWAHEMTPQDYQDLIDRGWRRSGKYCYKPSMSIMCCPSYTIKCAANDFQMSKSQKKVLKNFAKYISTGLKPKTGGSGGNQGDVEETDEGGMAKEDEKEEAGGAPDVGGGDRAMKSASASVEDIANDCQPTLSAGDASVVQTKKSPSKGVGADPNKPKAVKKKQMRKEKRLAKMKTAGSGDAEDTSASAPALLLPPPPQQHSGKTLEEHIDEILTVVDPKVKFEVKLIKSNPPSDEFQATFDESFAVYKKYQMVIHNDEEDKLSVRQYKRFLCHSPIFPEKSADEAHPFGSYHQHYYLDGRLIAVGVIDVLPYCVSSVYLYYDPDFHFLTLGTFAALYEIYFTRQLISTISTLEYYYMGFYIHSCPKMRYKGAYTPSFLLCPETNTWHPIEDCRAKLDANKYCRFHADPEARDVSRFSGELAKVKILHKGFPMTYEMYRNFVQDADDDDQVRRYAGYVGRSCENILLYRD